ncbi:hypothetical protein BDV12DRAFT_176788 [Aspergillus spectabilis]
MQINLKSRSTRIFTNCGEGAIEKINEVCQRGVQQEQYDPFIFFCSSISELLHNWVIEGFFRKIRETEVTVPAFGESFKTGPEPESQKAREEEKKKSSKSPKANARAP